MKNIFRILTLAAVSGVLMLSLSSCGEKFINETQRTKIDSGFLETPEGLYSMSTSLYLQFREMFVGESWPFTMAGTDEFMIGGDGASEAYNTYDARYASKTIGSANTRDTDYLWNMLYTWLNRANRIIDAADILDGYAKKNETLGTAYFVRGFDYLILVNQHGDVPLVLHAATGPEREYSRQSREEVYKQLIEDLENAYKLLPDKGDVDGKIDKSVAAHYLAQAHLWRASECNDDWNSSYKTQDLVDCIRYAEIVIAAHPLVARYEDLFANYTKNGSAPDNNTEIVLKASHTVDTTERGSANVGTMTLCWFVMPYQNAFTGFMDRDVAGGRSYQRLKNTPRYTYFIYDLKNDSRFWKSFKTTWAINKIVSDHRKPFDYKLKDGTTIYMDEYFGPHKTEATFSKYLGGMYIINRKEYGQKFLTEDIDISYSPKGHKLFKIMDYNTGKYIPDVKALLTYANATAAEPENTSMNPNKDGQFPMLSKYLDGAVDKYNLANGFRDQVIARSAEDYFFKAEALIRQGKIDEGIAVLKPLRDRAQFRQNEERDKYMDGGMAWATNSFREGMEYEFRSVFYGKSSYFYSVGGWDKDQAYRDAVNAEASVLPVVTSSNYPAEDEYVMNFLAETNPKYKSDAFTRAMCYLLNEKSREMYGESKRYNDLVRTRTLEDRLRFNDQAWSENPTDILGHTGNKVTQSVLDDKGQPIDDGEIAKYSSPNGGHFKSYHYLRPIPQSFLENITKDGHALTTDEINEMQNPGY